MRCAAPSQCSARWRCAMPSVPKERRIEFRIGINLGDIIIEDDDIYGDGVNVAARLEALAEPGGICVSRVVHDQVRDKVDFGFEDLGEQQVKNIARPVHVYRIAIAERPMRHTPLAVARQAVARGVAVPEHERRPGAGVFRRRHGRGDHDGDLAIAVALRDRAQFELHLQGQSRRREAGGARIGRALCARRLGAQGPEPRAHHRPIDRHHHRCSHLGRPLRRRAR